MTSARVGAAVKANAYGLGIDVVAPVLAAGGCDDYFVASVAEGIELRQVLPEATIHVFNGAMPGTIDALMEHRLVPVLISMPQIDAWAAATAASTTAPCGLHFDTGMSRTGLTAAEAAHLAEAPVLDRLDITVVMSHLACADDPDSDHPEAQLERFRSLRRRFPHGVASLANSAGTFRGSEFHFDVVRPGIAIYGGAFADPDDNPMEPTVVLEAPILQVDEVQPDTTVGYGATYRVDVPARHAVVPVGYADGFLRAGSNTGHMWIAGHRCPIVGRVSMDLTVLDVTDVPNDALVLGAPVEVFGDHERIDDVAAAAGTIGYELLTELGRRYERVSVPD
jgi:alanine racemase